MSLYFNAGVECDRCRVRFGENYEDSADARAAAAASGWSHPGSNKDVCPDCTWPPD